MKSKSILVLFAMCVVAVAGCGNQPGAAPDAYADAPTDNGCQSGYVQAANNPMACCPPAQPYSGLNGVCYDPNDYADGCGPGGSRAVNDPSVCCPDTKLYIGPDGNCTELYCPTGYFPSIDELTCCIAPGTLAGGGGCCPTAQPFPSVNDELVCCPTPDAWSTSRGCCQPGDGPAMNDPTVCCPADSRYYYDGFCHTEPRATAPPVQDAPDVGPRDGDWFVYMGNMSDVLNGLPSAEIAAVFTIAQDEVVWFSFDGVNWLDVLYSAVSVENNVFGVRVVASDGIKVFTVVIWGTLAADGTFGYTTSGTATLSVDGEQVEIRVRGRRS